MSKSGAETSSPGLAVLAEIMAERRPCPPIWGLMSLRLVAGERGKATVEGMPGPDHDNGIGSIHGGYIATILDTAIACAVQSVLDKGERYSTAEIKVMCLRPIFASDRPVLATGRIISSGRRLIYAEAHLRDGEERLLAHWPTSARRGLIR